MVLLLISSLLAEIRGVLWRQSLPVAEDMRTMKGTAGILK
jgi:hypothetical protein